MGACGEFRVVLAEQGKATVNGIQLLSGRLAFFLHWIWTPFRQLSNHCQAVCFSITLRDNLDAKLVRYSWIGVDFVFKGELDTEIGRLLLSRSRQSKQSLSEFSDL
jgi:hypothetical protein